MKKSYRFILAALLLITLTGILAALYTYNLKHKDLQNVKPDFVVSAEDLLKAFESDENGASIKYVNKVLEVSGTIQSFKPGQNAALSISLKTNSDFSSVICTLQGNPDTSDFRVGEQIILRGECSGFLLDVLLNNCSVIRDNN